MKPIRITYFPEEGELAMELYNLREGNQLPKRITKKFCLELIRGMMAFKYYGLSNGDFDEIYEEQDYQLAQELIEKYNL
jgi:hypothetical protein